MRMREEIWDMMGVLEEGRGMLEANILSICMGLVSYLEEHQRLPAR